MPRDLFIVARDRAAIHQYLSAKLSATDVEVIYDRRHRQRRQNPAGRDPDRRGAERRQHISVDSEVARFGCTFVRTP